MRNSRSNSRGPKKTESRNRFADGPRSPRFSDSNRSKNEGKKDFKRGPGNFKRVKRKSAEELAGSDDEIRLNRFLSTAGICNRREADDLIAAGLVQINGKVVTTMGYKVKPTDTVKFNGSLIKSEKKKYLLLNKPKGFITTVNDNRVKKSVDELIGNATRERLYPVGTMDRSMTGVLLFTNDADTAKKLTHPSRGAVQILSIVLDKALAKKDLLAIQKGLELEDGKAFIEEIRYANEANKREIGIRVNSGKNRLVHRVFDSLGYAIEKLDRVSFAGLTKKNLSRGEYRLLDTKEIDFLKTR